LRRRLFERIDHAAAARVIEQYRALWQANRECLSPEASDPATLANFRASYPLHPDVLHTFSIKTNTIAEFQRLRGMLRLLGRTIARLWDRRSSDATAIHLHHIDPGFEPIRQEIVTRMGQTMYSSAILSDVASETGKRALAEEQDEVHHQGLPPYAAYVARTVLMHSLAHNVPLRGCTSEHLRYDILRPRLDISFIEAARQRFVSESAFLDDTPGVPMRFQTQANLTQVILDVHTQGQRRMGRPDHGTHAGGLHHHGELAHQHRGRGQLAHQGQVGRQQHDLPRVPAPSRRRTRRLSPILGGHRARRGSRRPRFVWTGVARAAGLTRRTGIAAQHVGEPKLVRRRLLAHDGVDKRHGVLVAAHSIRAHSKAGEPVGSVANRSHASIGFGADYRCFFATASGAAASTRWA
jgi:hypothetical protein